MKKILNFTGVTGNNGYRCTINAVVVHTTTDTNAFNEIIKKKVNLKELGKKLKKGKSHEAAVASLVWCAVRAVIKAQTIVEIDELGGILIPSDVPSFITSKLERKLQKRGMGVYKVSDLSYA